MRVAVNTSLLFGDLPLERRPQAARDAGFTAVESWWPFDAVAPAAPRYPLRRAEDALAVVDRVAAETGVRAVGLLLDLYHLAVNGEDLALPLAGLAGSRTVGDAAFDEVFHPMGRRLVARCDGVLRLPGASAGSDEMVEMARSRGLAVWTALEDVPPVG